MVRGHVDLAKDLRHDATDAERRLWSRLRAHRFDGLKFRRQHPLGNFVVDFCCPELKLVVEVDGGQHADRVAADEARTSYLADQGFHVVRYWNNEVMGNLDGVLEDLRQVVAGRRAPLPGPPPASGGRE